MKSLVSNGVVSYDAGCLKAEFKCTPPSVARPPCGVGHATTTAIFTGLGLSILFIPSQQTGVLAGPGGHTLLFYTQDSYAKDLGRGCPPFPPYLWENSPILLLPGNLDLNQLNGIKCSSSPFIVVVLFRI